MSLDVLTPLGNEADALGQAMGRVLAQHMGVEWVKCGKGNVARVDGQMVQNGQLRRVVECKVRNDSRSLIEQWGGSYLITADKLDDGALASRLLHVPFTLCAYLKPDQTAYWWRLTDEDGEWAFPFERAVTRTRRTVNGGVADRENAFLPMTAITGSLRIPYPLLRRLAGLSASPVQVDRVQDGPDGGVPGRVVPCST